MTKSELLAPAKFKNLKNLVAFTFVAGMIVAFAVWGMNVVLPLPN
jgi:hypothetical protein